MADAPIRRMFLAVDLDDDVRHGLAAHVSTALGGPLPGRPSPPANWHITLRFLGAVEETPYELLQAGLDESDFGPPFPMSFSGLGAFPRPARATVLWLGVDEGADALTGVAAVVEEAAGRAGFGPEDRPFHPHLTLSRLRPPQDLRGLVARVPPFPLRQVVERITVFESRLGCGPVRYEPLAVFSLR